MYLKLFVKSNRNLETAEALFHDYYPRLCDFARKFLNDAAMAEDVVQDVFVAICERREPLPEAEFAVKGLLYVAVRNACYNKLRHQKVVHHHQVSLPVSETSDPEILEAIISSEVMAIMMEAIASLPAGCAEVVRKGFMEGLSNAEIAEQLSISIHTVKSQKQRALLLLRNRLDPNIAGIIIPVLLIF